MYTVSMEGTQSVDVMLMAHTLKIRHPNRVVRIFDLKGSTVNRHVKVDGKTSNQRTLKDLNFDKMIAFKEIKVELSARDYSQVIACLSRDTQFLCGCDVMDYSMLLAIERLPRGQTVKTIGFSRATESFDTKS